MRSLKAEIAEAERRSDNAQLARLMQQKVADRPRASGTMITKYGGRRCLSVWVPKSLAWLPIFPDKLRSKSHLCDSSTHFRLLVRRARFGADVGCAATFFRRRSLRSPIRRGLRKRNRNRRRRPRSSSTMTRWSASPGSPSPISAHLIWKSTQWSTKSLSTKTLTPRMTRSRSSTDGSSIRSRASIS